MTDLAAEGRAILDRIAYLVLATADVDGTPAISPVFFTTTDGRSFVWVSAPDARHSQNIAARPEVSLVVLDSTVRPGDGQAVYVDARAEQVPDAEVADVLAGFTERGLRRGGWEIGIDQVTGAGPFRLYRAVASETSMLDKGTSPQRRTPVQL